MAAARTGIRTPASGWRDALPWIAVAGAVAYLVLIILPLLDSSFNVLTAHPEDYAAGSFGLAVNASYLALAIALGSIALSLLPVRRWSMAAPALLVPAVLLCLALAVDPIGVARANQWVLWAIVGLALAPTVTALTLRHRFGAWTRPTTGLALAVLVAFIALAVGPDSVGGLVNRVFDALIGLWIVVASLGLRRRVARPQFPTGAAG